MNEEVRRYLEKAEHALFVAESLLEHGHIPDAASKTYYAMFYATNPDERDNCLPQVIFL